MKVTHELPKKPDSPPVTLASMPFGSIGVLKKNGRYYLRTRTLTCLSYPGDSYTETEVRDGVEDEVELLPRGSRIILEVE